MYCCSGIRTRLTDCLFLPLDRSRTDLPQHAMCSEVGDDVAWTTAELVALRQSIRENGVEDWRTLGDWSKVNHYHFAYGSRVRAKQTSQHVGVFELSEGHAVFYSRTQWECVPSPEDGKVQYCELKVFFPCSRRHEKKVFGTAGTTYCM